MTRPLTGREVTIMTDRVHTLLLGVSGPNCGDDCVDDCAESLSSATRLPRGLAPIVLRMAPATGAAIRASAGGGFFAGARRGAGMMPMLSSSSSSLN
jgi:hypothetical protein